MLTLRRILCATDLSPASESAWAFAQRLGLGLGAEVSLLHVMPLLAMPVEMGMDAETLQLILDEEREAAASRTRELAAAAPPGLKVRVELADGVAGPRIVQAVEEMGADLVIVGTHGRTGLDRLLVGSVAEHVVHLARCPVVTVRPESAIPPAPQPIRRILYPTDFSPEARRAWPWARAIAEATGASVDLLHVLFDVVPDREVDPEFLARTSAAIRSGAQRMADEFIAGSGLEPARVAVQLVHGVDSEQIVHWARSQEVDLIVMGTHGRTGFLRLALGSVARRVLHDAPCPVLTVGPETATA